MLEWSRYFSGKSGGLIVVTIQLTVTNTNTPPIRTFHLFPKSIFQASQEFVHFKVVFCIGGDSSERTISISSIAAWVFPNTFSHFNHSLFYHFDNRHSYGSFPLPKMCVSMSQEFSTLFKVSATWIGERSHDNASKVLLRHVRNLYKRKLQLKEHFKTFQGIICQKTNLTWKFQKFTQMHFYLKISTRSQFQASIFQQDNKWF